MSMVRHCDKCGQPIDTNSPLNDRSWVQVAVSLDEQVRDAAVIKDYHRDCAHNITIPEAWAKEGLIPL